MTHYSSIYSIFKAVDTTLTQVSNMQSFLMKELVYGYGSILYFVVGILVIVLLGTSEMFEGVRNKCLAFLITNLIIEKLAKSIGLDQLIDLEKLRWVFLIIIAAFLIMSYKLSQKAKERVFR
jgi:phosphoglycerol transferase MdoB-like AlkP superfamily enzyme